VVELVGAVVRWNRELIGHLADAPLLDPRVRVIEGDVAGAIATARETTRASSTSTMVRKRSPAGRTNISIRSRGSGARERP
jgi:hypothetical protein